MPKGKHPPISVVCDQFLFVKGSNISILDFNSVFTFTLLDKRVDRLMSTAYDIINSLDHIKQPPAGAETTQIVTKVSSTNHP